MSQMNAHVYLLNMKVGKVRVGKNDVEYVSKSILEK